VEVRLACIEGPCEGRLVAFGPGSHLLGRETEAGLALPEDEAVSGQHAVLVVRPGAALIADLESHNGTFVNGTRIRIPTQLVAGDTIQIGNSAWSLAMSSADSQDEPPSTTATDDTALPRLQFLLGERAGELVPLNEGAAFMVGRDRHCDLVLDDTFVSRQHATFFSQPEQVTVLDNDSSNGVRVNDHPVRLATLTDGDVVEIGKMRFRYLARGTPVPPLSETESTDPAPELPPTEASVAAAAGPPLGRFGPYLLLTELGRGGMGRVFEARRGDEEPVALKLVIFKGLDTARTNRRARRFEREVVVLRRIKHENVVGFRDAGVVDQRPYLAMELLQGRDLSAELHRKKKLPSQQAERILFQLCAAVGAVHEAGIIHRDLKPSNVILHGASKVVKLTDFGIARPLDQDDLEGDEELLRAREELSVTGEGRHPGTPLYMAPEQIRGEALDMRSDIWALGVVLYQLLSGRHPFPGRTASEVMRKVETAAPLELPESVPSAIRSAVYRCLLKPPEWRFASANALMDALHERRLDQLFPVGDRPSAPLPVTACPYCQAGIAAGRERCPACRADLQAFAAGHLRQVMIDGRSLAGCGRCGQRLQPETRECPRCGHSFGRRSVVLGPAADLTESEAERLALGLARLRQCPHCGATVDPGASNCGFCGLLLRAFLIGRIGLRKGADGEVLICGACREPLRAPKDTACSSCGLSFESGRLPGGKAWHADEPRRSPRRR